LPSGRLVGLGARRGLHHGPLAVLVFTRRRGETIIIGDGIEVRVLRVGNQGVRLGIVAPASTPVHRQEIHQQICEANRAAAESAGSDAAQRAAIEARLKANEALPRTKPAGLP
jgi:carbon storage regulator